MKIWQLNCFLLIVSFLDEAPEFPIGSEHCANRHGRCHERNKKGETLFVNHLCHLTFRELFALQNGYVLNVILRTPFLKQVLNGFHDFVALYCKNLSLRVATIVLISYI